MKKSLRTILIFLFAALFAVSAVNTVFAISTADAKEKIDTQKSCSLTLTYAIDGNKIEGLEIEIYQAATVTSDFQYSMTGDFAGYQIEINGIKSQSEWEEVKDTVTAYIAADNIAPKDTQTTDENGVVKFEELPVGIYYVRWTGNETVDPVQGFAPFMIAVPGLGEDGKWIYDVKAFPKPGMIPEPSADKLTLVKLWKDGTGNKRPQSVLVEIFRNGKSYETVELTEENNWTYTWETEGVCTWTAVERNVPEGYTVSIQSKDGNTIQITNTRPDDPPPPPQTGDTSNLYIWIILMALSGICLVILSVRRKKPDEKC